MAVANETMLRVHVERSEEPEYSDYENQKGPARNQRVADGKPGVFLWINAYDEREDDDEEAAEEPEDEEDESEEEDDEEEEGWSTGGYGGDNHLLIILSDGTFYEGARDRDDIPPRRYLSSRIGLTVKNGSEDDCFSEDTTERLFSLVAPDGTPVEEVDPDAVLGIIARGSRVGPFTLIK